ncbi:indolepyruvate oxidoreductase subunit beta [Clostridium estertheticum]|uniref:indolepyruvate oxidoreductase subunit beta n=1 Tax=Clostridium estertheticum TaxID=238834 RepID=UPI0013EEDFD3|nr:indolepyruvate oxidoreductase subunit beta [Clostridium estertheticum]MBZ9609091.1 indolepyruvate oxidoreductase subunit beta [Clostridium estertheticum]
MNAVKSIILTGIGGKGVITISNILSNGLVAIGYDVKVSEVHGMSQRGGSVHAQVRFGDKIYSPLIEKGTADIILGFDRLEALRWGSYLKKDGLMIVNNTTTNIDTYKGEINNSFDRYNNVKLVEARLIVEDLGNNASENFLLFGVLLKSLDFNYSFWKEIFKENIKKSYQESSIISILRGMEEI